MNPEAQQRTVNIEIGDKEWEGVYSNFVIITHSTSEFVLENSNPGCAARARSTNSRIASARSSWARLERPVASGNPSAGSR